MKGKRLCAPANGSCEFVGKNTPQSSNLPKRNDEQLCAVHVHTCGGQQRVRYWNSRIRQCAQPDRPSDESLKGQPTPPFRPSHPFSSYTQRPVSSAQPGLQDEVEREVGFAGVTDACRVFIGLISFLTALLRQRRRMQCAPSTVQ